MNKLQNKTNNKTNNKINKTNMNKKNNRNVRNIYLPYMNHVISELKKNIFTTELTTLQMNPINKSANEIFDIAYQYYLKNQNNPPNIYTIDNQYSLKYSAKNDENKLCEIAKGTFYLKHGPQIVNFYQNSMLSNKNNKKNNTETFRFGTPVHHFKDVSKIVEHIEQFNTTKKRVITVSLLSPCNSTACKSFASVAKPLSTVSTLLKKGLNATKENNIIETELEACNKMFGQNNDVQYYTILFPLSSQKYTGAFSSALPVKPNTYIYEKERYMDKIENEEIKNIYNLINVENNETSFKSIVNIAVYYYLHLKNDTILCYHCKSGKDRTSIFDSIVQSTFYYLDKHPNIKNMNQINENMYETIKVYCKKFLICGLVIAFFSTGVVGLKLKNIPIAKKYIFKDQTELFDKFIGHSSAVSS